jgi:hypothetical protein
MPVIRLEVEGGALVSYATIPPFLVLPDFVIWGQRHFRNAGREFDARPVYREGLAWVVVDPTPRDKP